jgi:hypothetical protein
MTESERTVVGTLRFPNVTVPNGSDSFGLDERLGWRKAKRNRVGRVWGTTKFRVNSANTPKRKLTKGRFSQKTDRFYEAVIYLMRF